MESFGQITDYFGVTSHATNAARLMLVAADSGKERRVTNLWNGAYHQGEKIVHPVCTFRIKAAGSVTFTLGKAWNNANGKYMLTDVEYRTGSDMEPVLVLKGCANEGADAINQYAVTFNVSPDHVAQDPYSAVVFSGDLTECNTTATCDPVVPYENNQPCASDVVHGKIRVTATAAAYDGEAEPYASGTFLTANVPKAERDVDFTTYAFMAERSL